MRNYDITIVIDPKDEVVKATKEKIKESVTSLGGTISKEDEMGIRTLGYVIKKKTQGYFYLLSLELSPVKVADLEKEFRLDEHILKYLTTAAVAK